LRYVKEIRLLYLFTCQSHLDGPRLAFAAESLSLRYTRLKSVIEGEPD
jgi:hypothetical protein